MLLEWPLGCIVSTRVCTALALLGQDMCVMGFRGALPPRVDLAENAESTEPPGTPRPLISPCHCTAGT